MEATRKTRTETTVTVKLTDWEANDLMKILNRLAVNPKARISEFSLREKSTGRRLQAALKEMT